MTVTAAKQNDRTRAPRKQANAGAMTIDVTKTRAKAASGKTATLKFGSVTMKVASATPEERARNVGLGQMALEKIKGRLAKPGVKLRARKGVPMFYADPTNPRRVVRVLDGKREVGTFENGVFKAQA